MPEAIYPSLPDKHVVVTGGGSGIGAALVASFARQGARTSFLRHLFFCAQAVAPAMRRARDQA